VTLKRIPTLKTGIVANFVASWFCKETINSTVTKACCLRDRPNSLLDQRTDQASESLHLFHDLSLLLNRRQRHCVGKDVGWPDSPTLQLYRVLT
jgi:hypothetical protein